MNGYNFSDRVRRVLQLAREEAARLRHQYVDSEHILLGIVREGEGIATAVLTQLNVDLEEIQKRIDIGQICHLCTRSVPPRSLMYG